MSEQQYRFVADRDWEMIQPGDRVTYVEHPNERRELVRIERPVPSTASTELLIAGEFQDAHPPTREQIAALERMRGDLAYGQEFSDRYIRVLISDLDAVLALIQNGADR